MTPALPEAPRWAWILIVFGVVANALLVLTLYRGDFTQTREVPATVSPVRSTSAGPVQLLVVGDGWTAGPPAVADNPERWPAILGRELAAAGAEVQVTVAASVGAGFLQKDGGGRTFRELAFQVGQQRPDLVIFFGSDSDLAGMEAVREAAEETLAGVRRAWPRAELLVVGPVYAGSPPESLLQARTGVQQAAEAVGAEFTDPLAEHWFTAVGRGAIDSGGYPTATSHGIIAARLLEPVEAAVRDGA